MKNTGILLSLFLVGLIITAAACTPEFPPPNSLLTEESSTLKASEGNSSASTGNDTAVSVTNPEFSQQESASPTKLSESEVINSVSFQWKPDDNTAGLKSYTPLTYTTNDSVLVKKFRDAYNGAVIRERNSEKTANDGVKISYKTPYLTNEFELWHGGYFCDGKRYDMDGYDAIIAVLKEIEEAESSNYAIWDDSYGELLSYTHTWSGYDGTETGKTTDKELLAQLEEALRDVRIIGTTPNEYICDDNKTYIFEGSKKTLCIEDGEDGYGINGQYYKLKGYDKIWKVLDDDYKKGVLAEALPDEKDGELQEVSVRWVGEGSPSEFYRTDDPEMLAKLTDALKKINVIWESAENVIDESVVILYTAGNRSGRIEFEHGKLNAGTYFHGRLFDINGYEAVSAVLNEIKDRYPEWQKKYDTYIHRMNKVDDRLNEATTDITYEEADIETRRTVIMDLLKELEQEDLIKQGSIIDNGDSVSFIYNCHEDGAYGSVMFKEIDHMTN